MKTFRIYASITLLLLLSANNDAQNIFDKINQYEKAVFSISSYNTQGIHNCTCSGFFISPDGIGIAPSNIFLNADSLILTLRNGKKYTIERILSTHKMANLTIFKATDPKKKEFEYIVPTQNTERNDSEVLVLSDPEETEKGVSLAAITAVIQAPYLDRLVILQANFENKSSGAPVINNRGELIGICGYAEKNDSRYFMSTQLLNDSLWINHPYDTWKNSVFNIPRSDLDPYMHLGIICFMNKQWVEAAKYFTLELRDNKTNTEAYIFRAEARRQYENYVGMRNDKDKMKELVGQHFLMDYFDAKDLVNNQQKDKAFAKYISAIEQHDSYAPALVDFGLLAIELRKDTNTALECFNKAIESTPFYAIGYYERSRLLKQYFNNSQLALEDIDKAISLNKMLPGAYSIRGTLKIQSGNYIEAISDFDQAIQINPEDTHALFNRGLSYYNLGMKDKCCQDWNTAGQLGHFKSTKYMSRYCNKVISKRNSQ
jgi:tetratricopeptide (TPR) repeat protein